MNVKGLTHNYNNYSIVEEQYSDFLLKWSILVGYRGSIAHGMYRPNTNPNSIDDIDLMGVVIPPRDYYLGLVQETYPLFVKGVKEIMDDPYDVVMYEVQKFMSLLIKSNPNALSLLWLDDDMYLKKTKVGQLLIDNRDLFTTKEMYPHYIGYAHGQLQKMTHFSYEGYMGEKRKGLVEKYGFDTKNASHTIRILRMGIEFLESGKLNVKRDDAEELLEIKDGKWTLEEIKEEAERLFAHSEVVRDRSTLPAHIDREKVSKLTQKILELELF